MQLLRQGLSTNPVVTMWCVCGCIVVMDVFGVDMYLFTADIANPDLFVCGCRTWICLDITCFYEVQHQPSQLVRMAGLLNKTVNRTLVWEVLTQIAQQFVTAVTAPPLVGCVIWSLLYVHILYIVIISGSTPINPLISHRKRHMALPSFERYFPVSVVWCSLFREPFILLFGILYR